jgi:hypothetical protein
VQSPIGRFVTLMMAVPILVLASSGLAPGQATAARAGATAASGSGPATGKYMPPRTPDGQPDISGMYEPGWISQPAETAVGGEWHPAAPKGGKAIGPTDFGARDAVETDPTTAHIEKSRKPMVVDPPDGKIPMQPWVAEKRKQIYAHQEKAEFLDPRVR